MRKRFADSLRCPLFSSLLSVKRTSICHVSMSANNPKPAPVLSIAVLWDEWKDKESGKTIKSCTMIITEPNKFVAKVHDRMPVLLSSDQFEVWLSGKAGTEVLKFVQERIPPLAHRLARGAMRQAAIATLSSLEEYRICSTRRPHEGRSPAKIAERNWRR
jgi:hypothetical protein